MDVHNVSAYQNAFRIPAEHLEARRLLLEPVSAIAQEMDLAVVSPDIGGVRRAMAFRETLARRTRQVISSAFVEKQRSAGVVSGERVVGDVEGRTVILVDDLISRGTTLSRAAEACRRHGAVQIWAAVVHGVFAADAEAVLEGARLNRLITTNTIPPFRLSPAFVARSVQVINAAPLFGEAILRMYDGRSLVELLED
jgi:ribose-phosphate pyrophosphokinase